MRQVFRTPCGHIDLCRHLQYPFHDRVNRAICPWCFVGQVHCMTCARWRAASSAECGRALRSAPWAICAGLQNRHGIYVHLSRFSRAWVTKSGPRHAPGRLFRGGGKQSEMGGVLLAARPSRAAQVLSDPPVKCPEPYLGPPVAAQAHKMRERRSMVHRGRKRAGPEGGTLRREASTSHDSRSDPRRSVRPPISKRENRASCQHAPGDQTFTPTRGTILAFQRSPLRRSARSATSGHARAARPRCDRSNDRWSAVCAPAYPCWRADWLGAAP